MAKKKSDDNQRISRSVKPNTEGSVTPPGSAGASNEHASSKLGNRQILLPYATKLPLLLNSYPADSRPEHGTTLELDSNNLLQEPDVAIVAIRIISQLSFLSRTTTRQSKFAEHFFSVLRRELNLPIACLREVDPEKDSLVFVEFDCDRAATEPRTFSLNDKNIIVNAIRTHLPIVDGDQTQNRDNPPAVKKDGARDDGSICSFPYLDNLGRKWLFTTCAFGKKDNFPLSIAAVLNTVFPVFTAIYHSIRYAEVASKYSETIWIDIHRDNKFRNRLNEIIDKEKFSNAFLAVASVDVSTNELIPSSFDFELLDGNSGSTHVDDRSAKEILLAIVRDNPTSSFVVVREDDKLRFETRDGRIMSPCPAPASWPSDLCIAIVPVSLRGEDVACIWLESKAKISLSDLLNTDKAIDSLEADLRSTSIERRIDRGEAVAGQALRDELADACANPNDVVLIVGPSGTGKLFYSRVIHRQCFGPKAPYIVLSPFREPNNARRFDEHLKKKGTVVLYRLEDFSRKFQIEVLRLIDEGRLADGSQLVAKIIVVLPKENKVNSDPNINQISIRERLKYSCVQVTTANIKDDTPRFRKLVNYLMDSREISGTGARELAPEVWRMLESYDWPGNLPELKRALRYMQRLSGGAMMWTTDLVPKYIQDWDNPNQRDRDYCKYCWDLLDRDGEFKLSRHNAAKQAKRDYGGSAKPTSEQSILTHAVEHARLSGMTNVEEVIQRLGIVASDTVAELRSKWATNG